MNSCPQSYMAGGCQGGKGLSNHLLKITSLFVCLALIIVPLSAQSAQASEQDAATQASSCVPVSVSVNPTSVSPGAFVGVFGVVTNCSSSKARIKVAFTSTAPCGTVTVLGTTRLALYPWQTVQVNVSYAVPPNACPGLYTVTLALSTGDVAMTTLTVT
jgi:hypothetical protein